MSGHTPAPWVVGIADWSDAGNARYEISSQKYISAPNSRLIAAAPELLAMLVETLASDDECIANLAKDGITIPAELLKMTEKTRALIAKATGSAS